MKANLPSISKKCRKHTKTLLFSFFLFFFHLLQMTQSVLDIGVCHFPRNKRKEKQKRKKEKPLLQCRATVNETRNISLFPEDNGV